MRCNEEKIEVRREEAPEVWAKYEARQLRSFVEKTNIDEREIFLRYVEMFSRSYWFPKGGAIDWKEYDTNDPATYPPKDGKYLVSVRGVDGYEAVGIDYFMALPKRAGCNWGYDNIYEIVAWDYLPAVAHIEEVSE